MSAGVSRCSPRANLGHWLALALLALGGCYHPDPANGQLLCANDGSCPLGYHCAIDFTCWRDGADPVVDFAAHPQSDLTRPDLSLAADLASARDLGAAGDLALAVSIDAAADLAVPDLLTLPDLAPAGPDLAPTLGLGAVCMRGADCISGFCADGVCCFQSSCASQCTSCALGRGSACINVPPGQPDPRGQCVDDPTRCQRATCDGQGGCQPAAAGTQCAAAQCSNARLTAPRSCDGVTTTCPAAAATACPNNFVCASLAACGSQCAGNAQCAPGWCCRGGACLDVTQASSCGSQCLDCTGAPGGHACVGGTCGCASDLDCAGVTGRPRCDGTRLTCVACTASADCSPQAPFCSGGTCFPCAVAADCAAGGWGTSCVAGVCECAADADCNDPGGRARRCDANAHCVCGSTGGACGSGQACSDATPSALCQ